MGLKFALKGYKTIVLTIDPARRLASSLGIVGLTDTPTRIDLPEAADGEMWAMMLDTKRTFDRLVEKYSPTAEVKERIFNNMVYKHMSQMLAGTQEYMAMERLYEIHQNQDYEIIVLDTPPMQNALDFLTAPQRMTGLINNSFMQLLLKPAVFFGKSGYKILERGARQIFKLFDRIAGFQFLEDLSDMFISFKELLGGFQARAEDVKALMAQPSCSFISVCATSENSISEALMFRDQLLKDHYQLEKIIVNRVYKGAQFSDRELDQFRERFNEILAPEESDYVIANYRKFMPLIQKDTEIINELSRLMGASNVTAIPLFLSDVHDIEGLQKVSDELVQL